MIDYLLTGAYSLIALIIILACVDEQDNPGAIKQRIEALFCQRWAANLMIAVIYVITLLLLTQLAAQGYETFESYAPIILIIAAVLLLCIDRHRSFYTLKLSENSEQEILNDKKCSH